MQKLYEIHNLFRFELYIVIIKEERLMEHNIGVGFIVLAMVCLSIGIITAIIYIFNFIIAILNGVKPKDMPKNNKKYLPILLMLIGYIVFYGIGFVLINK